MGDIIEGWYNGLEKPTKIELESEKCVTKGDIEPGALNNQVEEAICTMNRRKTERIEEIPVEFITSLNGKLRQKFMELCKSIYKKKCS